MIKYILIAALILSPLAAQAMEQETVTKASPAKAKIDTNGDGAVSKEEFMAAQEKRFADMDTDGDDSISDEEYKGALGKWKEKRAALREKLKEKRDAATPAEQKQAEDTPEE